jgi:hypothetical protein
MKTKQKAFSFLMSVFSSVDLLPLFFKGKDQKSLKTCLKNAWGLTCLYTMASKLKEEVHVYKKTFSPFLMRLFLVLKERIKNL